MSSCIVECRRIESIAPHPNADKLELAIIGGWQVVVGKGQHKAGELVTYVTPDYVVPAELSDRLGITKYLSAGRVRAARMRGEASFGFIMEAVGAEGENVADKLGITKFVEPEPIEAGSVISHPLFFEYTDIENLRTFTNVLQEGEPVHVTEKVDGQNVRIGVVKTPEGDVEVSGSRNIRFDPTANTLHSLPWSVPGVREIILELAKTAKHNVILCGEIVGMMKGMKYGLMNGARAFYAFDCMIDSNYMNQDRFAEVFASVPRVPVIAANIPFSMSAIAELSKGTSLNLMPGASHMREGVIVRPVVERTAPNVGRVILKYVSDDYLCRK